MLANSQIQVDEWLQSTCKVIHMLLIGHITVVFVYVLYLCCICALLSSGIYVLSLKIVSKQSSKQVVNKQFKHIVFAVLKALQKNRSEVIDVLRQSPL